MSCALSFYFTTLFQERRNDGEEEDGCWASPPAELIFDNARIPSVCLGYHHSLGVGSSSEKDSCHTRSTISTCNSTLSAATASSNHSTGSNSSAGSCRWDSNPTSNKEKKSKAAMLLNRPKRPGRKTSDNCKHRSPKQTATSMVEIELPQLLGTCAPFRVNNDNNNKCDMPQRPSRTLSSGSTSSTASSNASSHHTEKRGNHRQKHGKESSLDIMHQNGSHESPSLDKMLLHSKKLPGGCSSSRDSDSSSDHSLKEIFRSASHQRRSEASMNNTNNTSFLGARMSPTRTVNEILGQSMEELQISW
jgi:hypothetical protein